MKRKKYLNGFPLNHQNIFKNTTLLESRAKSPYNFSTPLVKVTIMELILSHDFNFLIESADAMEISS